MTTVYDTSVSIEEMVQSEGGVVKISLGQLRAELGYQRLGKHVLSKMSERLSELNLGYFPNGVLDRQVNPEPRQWQEIWVYSRDDSLKSRILDAVADPDGNDLVGTLALLSQESGDGEFDFSKMSAKKRLEVIQAAASV